MYAQIRIKKEKERFVYNRHPWVYRESLISEDYKDIENGAPVYLVNSQGNIVATGSYSSKSIIAVRIFEFKQIEFSSEWWSEKIKELKINRQLLGFNQDSDTSGFRLAFGESDGLPGLVIDIYNKVFVVQSATAFIDIQLGKVADALFENFEVDSIYSKSNIEVRKEEGIAPDEWKIYSEIPTIVKFKENGFEFVSDIKEGQKTGYYLDQKSLRQKFLSLTPKFNKAKVLNLFSYTGATSVYAIKAGASSVLNVDLSERALDISAQNAELNNISLKNFNCEKADVFDWVESTKEKFDIVILDPPALIKGNKFKERGEKAYHYLNKAALKLVNKGGLFITSSCSHFFYEEEFAFVIRQAATQLGLDLKTLYKIEQAPDHPYSIYFPEGQYLKSFILEVK